MGVVRAFLIGCAVLLLVVGCAGTSSETSNKEKGHSPEATASTTASKEDARCEGTRTIKSPKGALRGIYTTNDLPGCPKGGLLLGTNGKDKLAGEKGDDEIRGLGAKDVIVGGDGNDVIYAGPGNESFLWDGKGDDVIYGGDGDDYLCCAGGARTSNTVGMATISSKLRTMTASQTSSIAAKARTDMA
jgi:Ca2+-binding RTX toxin-like protein